MDVFLLGSTKEDTGVVASLGSVKLLVEHLNTSHGCFGSVFHTHNFDSFTDLNLTAFYTTGYYGSTTFN